MTSLVDYLWHWEAASPDKTFVTADERLAGAGLALRLRKEGRRWVQTLKGRGDGVMNRLEHEVELPASRGAPELDIRRRSSAQRREAQGRILRARLEPGLPLLRCDALLLSSEDPPPAPS